METKTNVMNVPEYAKNHKFWIVRPSNNMLWFYGAYDDEIVANRNAKSISDDAIVVENITL